MTASPFPQTPKRNAVKSLLRIATIILLLALIYTIASAALFWRSINTLQNAVTQAKMPGEIYGMPSIQWKMRVSHQPKDGNKGKSGELEITEKNGHAQFTLKVEGQAETPLVLWKDESTLTLGAPSTGAYFQAPMADPAPVINALAGGKELLPKLTFKQKLGITLAARPRIVGFDPMSLWVLQTSFGRIQMLPNGAPHYADLKHAGWSVHIGIKPIFSRIPIPEDITPEAIPGDDLMLSLAEAIRIAQYNFTPIQPPPDGVTRSGRGWMEVREGRRQLYLSGTPYEVGFQHGDLAGDGVGRMARRLVYGVGLLYSIKQKEWFPAAARKLVERQRPFIHPDYFEEMRGLAAGTGLPLDLIQSVNIFPEFFHCSGVALMGEATKGGTLLHARVLDYMVGVGLQDEAAVMAIERPGKNRFVTVGYLGFIGSVTGMNEHQVAIGEMGGAGQGDWDGIPMSLLIRQSLEDCETLDEVEKFMRESPRTCEYYYLITDGKGEGKGTNKGPKALGIAATPEKFETFGPGVFHERLNQPIGDAVLLSGKGRYEKLVERVKADYGEIDLDRLIEIIKRPVSMKSNLHNVIFEPQSLRLAVADASRNDPACNEPYRIYTWSALFSDSSAVTLAK